MSEDSEALTDDIKAAVRNSGTFSNLKQVSYEGKTDQDKNGIEDLKQQAETVIDNIQQLLDSANLDDSTSQKLSAILLKVRSALGNGTVSRAALATALAEATTAVSGAADKGMSAQQKSELLWQRVETDNQDIDDDFTKMRKAGIVFNDGLWNKHKGLMEYLKDHPRDIGKQKELDAVDDAMLMQAELQLSKCPEAKMLFDDAKKKSEDRHEAVDNKLAEIDKRKAATGAAKSAFDDDGPSSDGKLTMNDIAAPPPNSHPQADAKNNSQKFVCKQTNVYVRTNYCRKPVFSFSHQSRNILIFRICRNVGHPAFLRPDTIFCSKVYVGLPRDRKVRRVNSASLAKQL